MYLPEMFRELWLIVLYASGWKFQKIYINDDFTPLRLRILWILGPEDKVIFVSAMTEKFVVFSWLI